MMLTATLGERIVSKATAETLGSVDGVVIEAGQQRLVALTSGKGRKARVIPWKEVSGVGSAAVVVEHDDAAREPAEGFETQQARGDAALMGGLILSDRGNALGAVVDVEYDAETGALTSIRTSQSLTITGARLRAIGAFAWIVAAGDDEAGVASA